MWIFDRWGENLFHTRGYNGWDGYYKLNLCKQDIYTWKVVLKDYKRKQHEYVGHLTLVR